jgi:hypothetical protein
VYREGLRFFQRVRRWDRSATWEERVIVKSAAIAAFPLGLVTAGLLTSWLWDQWSMYSRPGRTPELVQLLFDVLPPVLIAGPAFAAVFYLFAPIMNRAIARGWVSENRCGSCGYALGEPSPHGTRSCSECGAVWSVPTPPAPTTQNANLERVRGILPRLAATPAAENADPLTPSPPIVAPPSRE